jgi:tetratricopeptide (TPR) repeat protein
MRHRKRAPGAPLLLAVFFASACGGLGTGEDGTTAASIEVPDEITDETYAEYARVFIGLRLDDGARAPLRERLVAFLSRDTRELLASGEYEEVLERFGAITDYYSPEDLGAGRVPSALRPLAERVIRDGSPRGDEAAVLSAHLVLETLDPEGEHHEAYEGLVRWGREARATLPNALERYSRLIDVWQVHAALTPTPEVLATLARLHVERRDAILSMIPGDGPGLALPSGVSFAELRMAPIILRRAPLEVAGVYLAHGDVASALSHVEAMGDAGGSEMALLRALRDARDGEDDAQLELAFAYAEGQPQVARGLCRHGLRRRPDDARYAVCLARVAAADDDFAMATGWYAEAIDVEPEERGLYDEALDNLGAFIARGLFDSDPADARAMARAAERILEERTRRFPDSEPSVTAERLHYVVGLLEMNAGNPEEARRRLEASVAARDTADAQRELGRIAEGTGRPADAARHYRRALDLTSEGQADARAELTQHLGDALRASGDTEQAGRMYRQSLELWEAIGRQVDDRDARAQVAVRRGILLDNLGRQEDSRATFREAIETAPGFREIYARILSHLVVSTPDVDLANEVFVKAQRQLTLEPEWKVYFALWVVAIAARSGGDAGSEAVAVLRAHATGEEWWAKLARFGLGDLRYGELLADATNIGQRTEAQFYQGTALLGSGDAAGAQRQFRLVLDSNMVNFYEFIMALELTDQR